MTLRKVEFWGGPETEGAVLMRGAAWVFGVECRAREFKVGFGLASYSLISGDEKT